MRGGWGGRVSVRSRLESTLRFDPDCDYIDPPLKGLCLTDDHERPGFGLSVPVT